MNISRVNLNLLVALDALLTESNVTRAAEKLFITQAAMSNTLRQLRDLFQDELLVKQGRQMVLTMRAVALEPEIKQLLTQAEAILQHQPFDPLTSKRIFVVGMEEYSATILLPALMTHLAAHAPHLRLNVKNIPLFAGKAMLMQKDIELAIGIMQPIEYDDSLPYEVLRHEKLVCIGKPNHPLFNKIISRSDYLAAKHISFMPAAESTPSIVDQVLEDLGEQRDIVLRLNHITSATYTLIRTDYIGTVPESLAKKAAQLLGISVQPCAIPFPESMLIQRWHSWSHSDSGCMWLRGVIRHIATQLESLT